MGRTTWLAMTIVATIAAPGGAMAQSHAAHGTGGAHRDLVEVASRAGGFGTLIRAVEAAGLVEVLRGEGPFTVFAPTDEAFARLPAGVLEGLLEDPERLAAVLTYHVVPGRVMAEDVIRSGGARPATVQGERLTIAVRNGKVAVDGAAVTATDIEASNGVIHVIDAVIVPRGHGESAHVVD
jgi:uncharacterized surface protein with fasciclin (FAS1) repeats